MKGEIFEQWRVAALAFPILATYHPKRNPTLQVEGSASLLFGSRNRAAVAYRVRATMARCSTLGPCAAVSRGRQAAQRASAWMPMPFRQHRDVLSKSLTPAHGLAAQGWAASATRGGLLFWLLFSWPHKRKVTRSPKAIDRSASSF